MLAGSFRGPSPGLDDGCPCEHVCVLICCPGRTSPGGSGPRPTPTSSTHGRLFEDMLSKRSQLPRSWGLRLQHVNFKGTRFSL